MNVFAVLEGVGKYCVAGHVSQQPEFDLRVIGDDEFPAGRRNEGGADISSELGPNGDVLQVRVRTGEAPGGGPGLLKRRVYAAVFRVDQRRQGVDVGALQFNEATVFKNLGGDGMG